MSCFVRVRKGLRLHELLCASKKGAWRIFWEGIGVGAEEVDCNTITLVIIVI